MLQSDKDLIGKTLAGRLYSVHLCASVMAAIEIAESILNEKGRDNTQLVREYGAICTGILKETESQVRARS